ncbi:hypothetical protein C064_00914 [Brucella suis 63/252]|nr:hypothetical protein DK67_1282 [Brucella suis bv. 3 str. 686]AIJ81609.1 hypothetical protein DK60_435 [Brucella canis]AIJ99647.1 hypothetical protein DO76_871 [Brucella suis]ENQ56851.1 hypothetical protein C969_00297 [Brucella canis CNGB 1172]ENQ61475.1 hypothetical protein C979_01857 [Brucella canis UK10/02]ENR16596.1 hypothetical protein C064_00914 [Brucella suis 63/252]ENS47668.1 hypothetical protein B976_01862 [Brucella canis 79/122]ENS53346.1 hypothetical protein C968_00272 [Brucella
MRGAEADGNQQPDRPEHQAARIVGGFAAGDLGFDDRPGQIDRDDAEGQQEEDGAENFDQKLGAPRIAAIEQVHLHMLAVQQCIASRNQEDRREKIPLRFQPGIGTDVEQFARDRINGADKHRHQHQPRNRFSDKIIGRINSTRQRQQD